MPLQECEHCLDECDVEDLKDCCYCDDSHCPNCHEPDSHDCKKYAADPEDNESNNNIEDTDEWES